MPYQTITEYREPDVFLEHNGVTVYHAYKDDEYDDQLTMWYAVGATCECGEDPEDGISFDVRDLPHPKAKLLNQPKVAEMIRMAQQDGKDWQQEEEAIITAIMKELIDAGVLTNQGIVKKEA